MKRPLLFIATIILSQFGFSQEKVINYSNARDGEDVEYCRLHKEMNKLLLNPEYLKMRAADQAMLEKQEELVSQQKSNGTVYTIPVVFHILHNGGNENISKDQVVDAMAIMNKDFRLLNSDANNVVSAFQGMPADAEIEFILATKAPNGTCFSGITRTQTIYAFDGSSQQNQVNAVVGGNDVYQGTWPGDEYLNVFVVADAGGAAGYTTLPSTWSQTSMYNGIWILHGYVGAIGTGSVSRSRALTHEAGHWLNLSHPWGNSNTPGDISNCTIDDGVTDTPNTVGVTSCALTESTCGPLANVENFMDYSYCSKMFTPGQVTRMRAAITSSIRSNHWSSSNLAAVGGTPNPPLCAANFYSQRITICEGETVDFIDDSYNGTVTSWNWTFTGGTPSSGTTQNPSITYNTPGTYSVTLQASDGTNTVSKTKNAYITVIPSTGINLPIYEGFENATSVPNADWTVQNYDNGTTWQVTSSAASLGSKSVKLNNYSNNEDGDIDELESMAFDLSNMSAVTMTFSYAYAQKNSSNTDRLQVLASNDCGASWSTRKTIAPSQLSTTGTTTTSNFVPSGEAEWKTITVTSIVSSFLTDGFKFKFLFTSGGGNNIYIDDINLYGTDVNGNQVGSPTSVEEFINADAVNVYPNPTDGEVSVSIDFTNRQDYLSIGIYDLIGKRVLSVFEGDAIEGNNVYNVSTRELSKGMYVVLINNGKNTISQKLVVK